MEIKIQCFGITKEILGGQHISVVLGGNTVADLKIMLESDHPKLKALASYMIAVNETYATQATIINPGDIVAIIPPVSGG